MKKFYRISLLVAIFLISAQFVYSCSCFQISNEAEIETTDFIFVGKVIEITEDKTYVPPKVEGASELQQQMIDTRKRYLVKFKIEKKFKGVESNEITLVEYEQEDSPCAGLSFEKGKAYLIYADKRNEEIRDSGLCSRTQNFDKKSKDYKELLNLKARKQIETKKS